MTTPNLDFMFRLDGLTNSAILAMLRKLRCGHDNNLTEDELEQYNALTDWSKNHAK